MFGPAVRRGPELATHATRGGDVSGKRLAKLVDVGVEGGLQLRPIFGGTDEELTALSR